MGFSLIELLVVISLLATVTLIAAPNFSLQTQNHNAISFAQKLKQSIITAKHYAKLLNQPLKICPSKNQLNCNQSPQRQNWATGYIIITHPIDTEKDARLIQYSKGNPHITVSKNGSISQRNTFYISRDGNLQNASFSVCDSKNKTAFFHLVTFYSGRIRFDNKKTECF